MVIMLLIYGDQVAWNNDIMEAEISRESTQIEVFR